jgi:sialate O-acetylesterase
LFVQLAPFRYGRQNPANCAELWEAQLRTLALPATGMAVTTDIGNVRDIHPRNKQDVGKRLALWALGTTYEKKIVYSGPLYEAMKVEGDAIRIRFKHTGGGLMSRDGKPLSDFTIAGADGSFQPATASVEGQDVVVRSDKVGKPAAVRFGWSDTAQPNLANKEGLPASPFRTDDFKRVTAGKK